MKIGKSIGWLLLLVAFVATASETAVQAISGKFGLVAAYDLLYTLFPGKFIVAQVIIEDRIHPLLWDPVLVGILALPAWVLLGVPGAILAWKFRAKEEPLDEEEENVVHTTFEDIVAAAEEAEEDEDLGNPSRYGALEDYDPWRGDGEEEDGPEIIADGAAELEQIRAGLRGPKTPPE